jgi:hypothetical protein
MRIFNSIIILCLTLICTHNVFSQYAYGTSETYHLLKNKKLIVALQEEDPETIKKLAKKPDVLQSYRQNIQQFNEYLKYAIANHWKFSTEIEYLPFSQAVRKLEQDKGATSNLLYYSYLIDEDLPNHNHQKRTWERSGIATKQCQVLVLSTSHLDLRRVSAFNAPKNMVGTLFPIGRIDQGSAIFTINHMQSQLDYLRDNEKGKMTNLYVYSKDFRKNTPELQSKTLLIPQEYMDEDFTAEEIKEYYPYPYKVCKYEEVAKAYLEKKEDIAVLELVPLNVNHGALNTVFITNAASGKLLLYERPEAGMSVMGKDVSNHALLNKKIFKKIKSLI